MARYYVNSNAQSNGDHEVHVETCSWLPDKDHRVYLGDYHSCVLAVAEAKRRGYSRANGCYYCCLSCHTT
ncbi:hypothetical protein SDC9_11671 [bioreactor metagenome]|uniref:Uncharacterized protein n=1 Tax=bioreactor metagenome TaxID=1076179 RepID=A0A644TGJ5_9ZZZZ|nr:hypothetical protein [Spirochaetia bacterium]